MNSTKYQYFCFVSLLTVLLLIPSIAICGDKSIEKYKPDQALVQASKRKAKEHGYSCVFLYKEKKEGNIKMFGVMHITSGEQSFAENDMLVNVGEIPIKVGGYNLLKGEDVVVKGGKFVKQPGKVTSD